MKKSKRMKSLKKTYLLIIAFGFVLGVLSCTKEKDPVAVTPVEIGSFNTGYLSIKLLDDPLFLDSIYYTNLTKGTSFKIDKADFFGFNAATSPITSISRPLNSGATGDEVQCCFYLNAPMELGVAFENMPLDSIPAITTGGNPVFCINGNY